MSTGAFPEGPLLEADPAVFARDFDKNCSSFTHRLSNSPLFRTDQLLALVRRRARDPNDVYYDAGDIRVDQRWDQTPPCDLPVDELLRGIETAGAWIVLRHVQEDPDYAGLLDACMDEIVTLSRRDLSQVMKLRDAIIFINSPNRISTYHMDRECNLAFSDPRPQNDQHLRTYGSRGVAGVGDRKILGGGQQCSDLQATIPAPRHRGRTPPRTRRAHSGQRPPMGAEWARGVGLLEH
jgi:hypothetical protein